MEVVAAKAQAAYGQVAAQRGCHRRMHPTGAWWCGAAGATVYVAAMTAVVTSALAVAAVAQRAARVAVQ